MRCNGATRQIPLSGSPVFFVAEHSANSMLVYGVLQLRGASTASIDSGRGLSEVRRSPEGDTKHALSEAE